MNDKVSDTGDILDVSEDKQLDVDPKPSEDDTHAAAFGNIDTRSIMFDDLHDGDNDVTEAELQE